MLPEAHLIILIHLEKVMNHSSSNECIFLQHNVPFPLKRGCPKPDILHEIWELFLLVTTWCWPCPACRCCQKLCQSSLYIGIRLWDTQVAMYVYPYSISLNCLWGNGYPKSYILHILHKLWELFSVEMTPCGPQQDFRCCQKLFQSSLSI